MGTSVQNKRKQRWEEQGGKCFYCNVDMWLPNEHTRSKLSKMATAEHVIPVSRGGGNHIANLICSCKRCNQLRGSIPHQHFLIIRKLPYWEHLASRCKRQPDQNLTNKAVLMWLYNMMKVRIVRRTRNKMRGYYIKLQYQMFKRATRWFPAWNTISILGL